MIVVKVIGGLGNQMFQVAFAKILAQKTNEEIYLDVSAYERYKIRDFSVDNLIISDSLSYIHETKLSNSKKLKLKCSQIAYRFYQKIVKTITNIDQYGEKPFKLLSKKGLYYNFDRYYYDFDVNYSGMKCIYGYFQSEKYFEEYKDEIKNVLRVKTAPTSEEQSLISEIESNSTNSVGISIRYGKDYRESDLNVCDKEYYYQAMDLMASKIENPIFYIFSDCVDEVKEDFKFKYPVRFVQGFKDYESLRLLYTCKNFIIANSSFSWWGAYLSQYEEKIIIAPSKWYNNTKKKVAIYFDEMLLIDVDEGK